MGENGYTPSARITPVPCPPKDSRPFVKQLVCPAGQETQVVCIHPQICGYFTHWCNGRTVPCMRSRMLCEGCLSGLSAGWVGYIGVVLMPQRAVRVLQVTRGAYRNNPDLERLDGSLRGRGLCLWRSGRKTNSPLYARFCNVLLPVDLPPAWDLTDTLARLWGFTAIGKKRVKTGEPLADMGTSFVKRNGGGK